MTSKRTPIALLGAGIFAKTAHLPAIAAAPSLDLVAVYSRSEASARSLLQAATSHPTLNPFVPIKIYFDVPSPEDPQPSSGTLEDLLKDADIELVVTALPIGSQAKVVEKAIKAGKSVFSEKPVAKDLEEAKRLVEVYEKERKVDQGWLVAEQYPYDTPYIQARELIRQGKIGKLESFSLEFITFVEKGSKYYETSWRKVPDYQGGFLLDGGVHFFAGLRWMLGGANFSLADVTSSAKLLQEHLPPYDTLEGTATATSSSDETLNGKFHISFGVEGGDLRRYTFQGSEGTLIVNFGRSNEIIYEPKSGEKTSTKVEGAGVENEFAALGEAMRAGVGSEIWKDCERRSGPRITMRDLGCIEGALTSGESGKKVDLKEALGGFW